MIENIDPELLKAISMQRNEIRDTEIKYQLDVTDIIDEIEHLFRGDIFDTENNVWISNDENRIMNEHGIRIMSSFLKTYLTRDISLSILEKDDLNRLCLRAAFRLSLLIRLKAKDMNLKIEYWSFVYGHMISKIELGMRRALNKITLDSIGKVSTTIEHIDRSQQYKQADIQQEKGGFFRFWK